MKKRGGFVQWLKERFYGVIENVVAGLAIVGITYVAGVLVGILPSISLTWLGGISLTLIVAIAVAVVVATACLVLWRRWRRGKIRLTRPIVVVPKNFVGREEEIAWFKEMLKEKTPQRVMSICGAPGIGKSWLVSRLAEECQNEGAVWAMVDFHEAAYEPLTLLDTIQRQLGEDYFVSFGDKLLEFIELRAQQQRDYPSLDDTMKGVLLQKKENETVYHGGRSHQA